MENEVNIFTIGYDKLGQRATFFGAALSFTPTAPLATVGVGGSGNYTGGLSNPITVPVSVSDLTSGAMPAVLFVGKTSFTDTTAGYRMGLDIADGIYKWVIGDGTSSADWAVTTARTFTVTGTIVAAAGFIGGWTITTGYLYDLTSGTPTAVPNNGVVMDSGNAALIIYEGTAERVRTGYLSAGVYGIRVFATDGTTVIWESSDTRQVAAGFSFDNTQFTIASGGNTTTISSGATAFLSGPTGAPTFSVTQAGAVTATSGTIGGWTLSATTLTNVSGCNT